MPHFDVHVIGAGAAGLAAARLLSARGRSVCLVESRDQIGGRVATLRRADLPLPLEQGAEFVHGAQQTLFADAAVNRALDALSGTFGVSRRILEEMFVASYSHDWNSDRFFRGAYSYAQVGGAMAHARLAAPVEETLFFAGEATSSDQTGTVPGGSRERKTSGGRSVTGTRSRVARQAEH